MAFFYFILVEIYFRLKVKPNFWNGRAGKLRRALRARGVPDSSIPINPPSTDPKLDTLCRKNLLRTQNRWSQKSVTNPISLRMCNFSRPTNWSVTGLKITIFAPCAASPPQLLPAPRYGSTTASGKICHFLEKIKWVRFFFAHSPFLKSAALGNRPSQSFISSLAPEKNVTYFLKLLEDVNYYDSNVHFFFNVDFLQRWNFRRYFSQRWIFSTYKFSTMNFSTLNFSTLKVSGNDFSNVEFSTLDFSRQQNIFSGPEKSRSVDFLRQM